jgi:hypothetical protein
LASTPVLAQPYSYYDPPGSLQDQVSKHNNNGTGGAPDEPAPTLPQPLGESGRGGSNENASELERDMQLALEEQEKSSSAPAPGSLCPRRPSTEPPHPQIEQEYDRGGTGSIRFKELRYGPLYYSQDYREEV